MSRDVRGRIDWKARARAGRRASGEPRSGDRHPHDAVQPLDRHPAAGRDQPRHGARLQGADPRRAHLEPGPRRGRAALRRHAGPACQRRGDPLRQPLPRAGVRDLRLHDRAAQRPAGGRVPDRGPASRGPRHQDDRPRARRPRGDLRGLQSRDRPDRACPCSRPRTWGAAACSSPRTSRCSTARSSGLAGLLGSGRTELARLLYGADRADSGSIAIDGEPARIDHAAPRDRAADRVLLRGPSRGGHRRRPHRRREHRAGHPGPPRLEAQAPQGRAGRRGRRVHRGART